MPTYFFDSSALVKFYIEETGTPWVRSLTDSAENIIHVASLARVETISALTRRLNRRDITEAEFDEAYGDLEQDFATQYRIVALTEAIIDNAARLARKHGLRANDAVQLSTAIDVRRILAEVGSITTALVTADLELNVAAVAEGFSTEDPNNQ